LFIPKGEEMTDKETREKKKKILYGTNPKHILYVSPCNELPLGYGGRFLNIYVSDHGIRGISLSISGVRGAKHAECFMEYRQLEKMVKQLSGFINRGRNVAFVFENAGDITIENASLDGYDVGIKTRKTGDIKMKNIRSSVKR